jgi:protoporphyrinogen IX oxidase
VLYLWMKALHVAAAITFAGGVLATALLVPLLHGGALSCDARHTMSTVRAWNKLVTTPAMLTVWTLGLILGLQGGWFSVGAWLKAKLLFVVVLSAVHGVQSGMLRRLAGGLDVRLRVSRFGAPAIVALAVLIAILATAKPF